MFWRRDKTTNEKTQDHKETAREINVGKTLHSILDGTILTRENFLKFLPFMFFLTLLAIIYIAINYYAERKVRNIEEIKKELKELRYEYITTKSELMFHSKQSEVAKKLKQTGVKEAMTPPEKIFVNPDKDND